MTPGGAAAWQDGFFHVRPPGEDSLIVDESPDIAGFAFGGRLASGITEVVDELPTGSRIEAPFLEPDDLVYNVIDGARYGLFRSRVP